MAKLRSMTDLRDEMIAHVRGETPAPEWLKMERKPLSDIVNVLSPANMELMRIIAEHHPATVSELADMSGRKQSSVSRSLQDLARIGLVRLIREEMSIRPELR